VVDAPQGVVNRPGRSAAHARLCTAHRASRACLWVGTVLSSCRLTVGQLRSAPYSVTKRGTGAFAEWLSATHRHRGIVVQAICLQGVQMRVLDGSVPLQSLLSHDEGPTPGAGAEAVWQGRVSRPTTCSSCPTLGSGSTTHSGRRGPDAWLDGMNKMQRRIEDTEEGR